MRNWGSWLRWGVHRFVRLGLFFGAILCLFPLLHLVIMLWGDLFSARLLAQRIVPSPVLGPELDLHPDDPFLRDLQFIEEHARAGFTRHRDRDQFGYEAALEGEFFSGLSTRIVETSLWHGIQVMALAQDFDGIERLVGAWIDQAQWPQHVPDDAVLVLENPQHPFDHNPDYGPEGFYPRNAIYGRINLTHLQRILHATYLSPAQNEAGYETFQTKVNLVRAGARLAQILDIDEGPAPPAIEQLRISNLMIVAHELGGRSLVPYDYRSGSPLLSLDRLEDMAARRLHGCPKGLATALLGFRAEFPRTSLNEAMGVLMQARDACQESPLLVDWISLMAVQTLNRQLWQIDAALFVDCTSEPNPHPNNPYPTLTQRHLDDFQLCEHWTERIQNPIDLGNWPSQFLDHTMTAAPNLQNDYDYLRHKLELYRDFGFVL